MLDQFDAQHYLDFCSAEELQSTYQNKQPDVTLTAGEIQNTGCFFFTGTLLKVLKKVTT